MSTCFFHPYLWVLSAVCLEKRIELLTRRSILCLLQSVTTAYLSLMAFHEVLCIADCSEWKSDLLYRFLRRHRPGVSYSSHFHLCGKRTPLIQVSVSHGYTMATIISSVVLSHGGFAHSPKDFNSRGQTYPRRLPMMV